MKKKDLHIFHKMQAGEVVIQDYWILKVLVLLVLLFLSQLSFAQSGGWDSWGTNGTAGNNDYGNGVIRLLSDVNTGCAAGAVHETSAKYDPTLGDFNQCYQVFFGCPGNDNIGSDANGDGMAFSFSKCVYNINNGLACGGGLGYMGACPDNKMFTIEFDTYSSQGNSGFDGTYGGGTSGNHDEISLQRDGNASDAGRIYSSDAGNLEDGLEHTVCISYNRTTHILQVSIDGVNKLVYDLTGSPYELAAYFGAGGLNQTWSSGKFGATNPSTVSNGASIAANLGGVPLCPAGIEITSPSDGAFINSCPIAPITITATSTPPAGNTTSYVEFFVDGVSIGTDNSANYEMVWSSPTTGPHTFTAVGHYAPSNTTSTSAPVNVTVGGVQKTSLAPVIDGTKEVVWDSYPAIALGKNNGAVAPDLAATYRMTYDNTYLYVLVNVTDDVLIRDGSGGTWEDDGIEIFIDIGNDKSGGYGGNDFQYSFNWNSAALVENKHGASALTGVSMAQINTGSGYQMEMRFPWSTLGGMPGPNTYMGFDVGVNDDDDHGTRDNQLSWNDGSFGEWNNTALFGSLLFTSCDPLPVSMLSFTGVRQNEKVVLDWITVIEINNLKYVVERSADRVHWESIGERYGAGNTQTMSRYSLTDFHPLEGLSYYRLKQIDDNGAFSYSQLVVIRMDTVTDIRLLPNPFDEAFIVTADPEVPLTVSLYDVLGRMLVEARRQPGETQLVIRPEIPAGTYVAIIQTGSTIEQKKIIKK